MLLEQDTNGLQGGTLLALGWFLGFGLHGGLVIRCFIYYEGKYLLYYCLVFFPLSTKQCFDLSYPLYQWFYLIDLRAA
jgi:hypothetical protein